jgi:hypothetical protein
LREAVSRIGDEGLRQRVTDGVNEALDRTIEGIAGIGFNPWIGPGAQGQIYPLAAELSLVANRYPEGPMRTALLTIAGQIVQNSLNPTGDGGSHRRK